MSVILCVWVHPLTSAWCSDVAHNMLGPEPVLPVSTIPSGEYGHDYAYGAITYSPPKGPIDLSRVPNGTLGDECLTHFNLYHFILSL